MEAASPQIPGYTLVARAGQGGMGTVFKAEQISPHRSVAIKVLSGARVDAAQMAAFRREAEVVAHLEHPRIVPLYDFGEHAGTPYLVLRYLGGGSVADRLRSGPLDLATAARWMGSIAEALDFAHQNKILHRDIKPSNILLDDAGNAYLTDFGLAGTLSTVAQSSLTGSAAYMSPEQAQGRVVDGRADIYALAVTFFEMLTGQKPYTAETALGVVVRHINDPIPSARALQPTIPSAVDELIQWGMAKAPDDRPQSAAEFGRWLRQALAYPQAPLRPVAATGQLTVVGGAPTVIVPEATTPARKALSPAIWIGGIVLVGLCLLGALVAGGGLFAAAWLSPTATPTPLATATPLPRPTSEVAPLASATPEGWLLADNFTDPHSGFAVLSDPDGGVAYDQGQLRITVNRSGVDWFSPSQRVRAANVDIQVEVQQLSGPAQSQWAVVCRWQDASNYTALGLNGSGQYRIWQTHGGGQPKILQDWKSAPSLAGKAGAAHHVQVTCADSTLSLTVDGTRLGSVEDPHPLAGDVALMAGLRKPGTLEVVFSQLLVTTP
jgi:hypothetical protein